MVKSRSTGVPAASVLDVTITESCQKPSKTPDADVLFKFRPGGKTELLSMPVAETLPVMDPNWTVPELLDDEEVIIPGAL